MKNKEISEKIEEVRVWAQSKIKNGQEPPWAWFELMKLQESCDRILAGLAAPHVGSAEEMEEKPNDNVIQFEETKEPTLVKPDQDKFEVPLPI